jgi:hypothetical protein
LKERKEEGGRRKKSERKEGAVPWEMVGYIGCFQCVKVSDIDLRKTRHEDTNEGSFMSMSAALECDNHVDNSTT